MKFDGERKLNEVRTHSTNEMLVQGANATKALQSLANSPVREMQGYRLGVLSRK